MIKLAHLEKFFYHNNNITQLNLEGGRTNLIQIKYPVYYYRMLVPGEQSGQVSYKQGAKQSLQAQPLQDKQFEHAGY